MRLALCAALIVPFACMYFGLKTGKFPWNCALTLSCALIVALTGRGRNVLPLIIALAISVIGDYFMAHKAGRTAWYIAGIGGFLLAHCAFLWYSVEGFSGSLRIWIAGAALLAFLGLYLVKRALPHISGTPMRIAVSVYALVSVLSVVAASGRQGGKMEMLLYTLGVMLIAFSDIMIAENDFVGNASAREYIMPTYYLCHIAVAASAIAGMSI